MKTFLRPLFYSFIPSTVVFLLTLTITFDINLSYNLLTGKEGVSLFFRLILIAIEVATYLYLYNKYKKEEESIKWKKEYDEKIAKLNVSEATYIDINGISIPIFKNMPSILFEQTATDDYIKINKYLFQDESYGYRGANEGKNYHIASYSTGDPDIILLARNKPDLNKYII